MANWFVSYQAELNVAMCVTSSEMSAFQLPLIPSLKIDAMYLYLSTYNWIWRHLYVNYLINFILLIFLESPTIRTFIPLNKTVNESDSVYFYCNATGLPSPTITWYKIENGGAALVTNKEIIFNKVNRADSGTYVCTATNGVLGNATASTFLNVQCKSNASSVSNQIKRDGSCQKNC
mgnify:CR=1 FL=1